MKNNFNLCPMCGSKKIECKDNRKWECPDCNFDLYCNVATAVGVIIKDKYNNVLFEVRGKEPRKGYYAVPGGFVDFDECAEDAAIRECGLWRRRPADNRTSWRLRRQCRRLVPAWRRYPLRVWNSWRRG